MCTDVSITLTPSTQQDHARLDRHLSRDILA